MKLRAAPSSIRPMRCWRSLTLDKDTLHEKQKLSIDFADLIYNGKWYSPLREALSAFVDKTQEYVTGTVKLKLYKGNIIPAGMTSPYTLYSEELATFDEIRLRPEGFRWLHQPVGSAHHRAGTAGTGQAEVSYFSHTVSRLPHRNPCGNPFI